jgi:hypothetical protein
MTYVEVTEGQGKRIDTFVTPEGKHRQVIIAHDPLPTEATNPTTEVDISNPNSILIKQTIGSDDYTQTIGINNVTGIITISDWAKL